MEPVGLAISLMGITAAVAKVGQLITELENADNEFEAIVHQFTTTRTILTRLQSLFMNPFLPPSLMVEYANTVQNHQSSLSSIEQYLRLARQNLNSKSAFKRLCQRRGLMERDLQRFTSQISTLNSNLNLIAASYNCEVTNYLVCFRFLGVELGVPKAGSSVRSMESKTQASQNTTTYTNLSYVEIVPDVQPDDAYADETIERSSTTGLSRYEEIRPTLHLTASTGMGTGERKVDRGPTLPPNAPTTTVESQNKKIRGEPGISTSGYLSDSDPTKFVATTTEETQQILTPGTDPWEGGYLLDSKPQSTFPPKKIQDEGLLQLTHIGRFGLWDPPDVQRVRNERWREEVLEQMGGSEYSLWGLMIEMVQNEAWGGVLKKMQGFEYNL